MLLRGLMRAGGKVLVATATAPALGDYKTFVWSRKIMKALAGILVIDDRPHGDFQDHAFAIAAGAVGAFSVASALAFVFRVKAEVDERVMPLTGLHHDVAAPAAVA